MKNLLLILLTGILWGLSFPPFSFLPSIFVAFVPLLFVLEQKTSFKTLGLAYLSGLVSNSIVVYWTFKYSFWIGALSVGLNALFCAFPLLAYHLVAYRLSKTWRSVAFIFFWLAWEYVHLRWEFSLPWLNLGNMFGVCPPLVQWYEYTGTLGGTLWVLLINVMVYQIWSNYKENRSVSYKKVSILACVLVFPTLFSIGKYYTYQEIGTPLNVVAIQPNLEPDRVKITMPQISQMRRFPSLMRSKVDTTTDYIVLPEGIYDAVPYTNTLKYVGLAPIKNFTDSFPKLHFVSGVNLYRILKPNEKPDGVLKHSPRGFDWEAYNSAITWTKQDTMPLVYNKHYLVPGTEHIPYRRYLSFLLDNLVQVDETSTRLDQSIFKNNGSAVVAPALCYEVIYGHHIANKVKQGANVIFNMTNEIWGGESYVYKQMLAFARLRCIETRCPLVRAANCGASAFINQRGDLLQVAPYNSSVALKNTILLNPNSTQTLYVQWGDYLGLLGLLGSLMILIICNYLAHYL
ncbi:MAG: apolipoprotein N-acyltransferase [Bacteroidota bacterium]|jgi:apolipoprotein N-acyltransferase